VVEAEALVLEATEAAQVAAAAAAGFYLTPNQTGFA